MRRLLGVPGTGRPVQGRNSSLQAARRALYGPQAQLRYPARLSRIPLRVSASSSPAPQPAKGLWLWAGSQNYASQFLRAYASGVARNDPGLADQMRELLGATDAARRPRQQGDVLGTPEEIALWGQDVDPA